MPRAAEAARTLSSAAPAAPAAPEPRRAERARIIAAAAAEEAAAMVAVRSTLPASTVKATGETGVRARAASLARTEEAIDPPAEVGRLV